MINSMSNRQVVKIPPKFEALFDPQWRYLIYHGGRGSSKSFNICRSLILQAYKDPIRVLCCREIQKSISDSVIQMLSDQIDMLGLQTFFDVQKTQILGVNGSRFVFAGLKSNVTSIKSMQGINKVFVEEGENVSDESWQALIPTIREPGSQIIVAFNPKNILDSTYQRFVVNPPERCYTCQVNWQDNAWFPDELRQDMEEMKKKNYQLYLHVYEGQPVGDSEYAIINPAWVEAAIDAHIKLGFEPSGRKVIGYDIADSGGDTNARCYAHGSVLYDCVEWHGEIDGILKSCKIVYNEADRTGSEIVYDSVGVGASAGGKFNEINKSTNGKVKHMKFVAGAKVVNPNRKYTDDKTNKDMFSNAKAQAWWYVADRFRNTYDAITNGTKYPDDELISISSKCGNVTNMCAELSRPRVDYDGNDRVKVESKKDMKKRDIPSPNMADALIMCFAPKQVGGSAILSRR